jgi:hypothetical protein
MDTIFSPPIKARVSTGTLDWLVRFPPAWRNSSSRAPAHIMEHVRHGAALVSEADTKTWYTTLRGYVVRAIINATVLNIDSVLTFTACRGTLLPDAARRCQTALGFEAIRDNSFLANLLVIVPRRVAFSNQCCRLLAARRRRRATSRR